MQSPFSVFYFKRLNDTDGSIATTASHTLLVTGEAGTHCDTAQAAAKESAVPEEIRSAEYLERARQDKYLPKPPARAELLRSSDVRISPMPLAD